MDELFIDTNGDYLIDKKAEELERQKNKSKNFETIDTIDVVYGVDSNTPK